MIDQQGNLQFESKWILFLKNYARDIIVTLVILFFIGYAIYSYL